MLILVVLTDTITCQVAVLADSDLGDEDTDAQECVTAEGMETEGDGGAFTEGDGAFTEGEGFEGDVGTHVVHAPPDTAVHHIVEDVTLQVVTKQEPHSGADL